MTVLDLWRSALETVALVSAPFLGAALVVGLTTSLLLAATQLLENVLAFVPKVLATGVVLVVAGRWLLDRLIMFCGESFDGMLRIAGEVGR